MKDTIKLQSQSRHITANFSTQIKMKWSGDDGKCKSNRVDSLKFIGKTRHEFLKINLYDCMSLSSYQFYREIYAKYIDVHIVFFLCHELNWAHNSNLLYTVSVSVLCVCGSNDNTKKIECVCYFRISLQNPSFVANYLVWFLAAVLKK